MASPRSKEQRPSTGSFSLTGLGLTFGAARCRSADTGAVFPLRRFPLSEPQRSHAVALADTPGRRAVSSSCHMSGGRPERQPVRWGLALVGLSGVGCIYRDLDRGLMRKRSACVGSGAFPFVGDGRYRLWGLVARPLCVYTDACVRWVRAAVGTWERSWHTSPHRLPQAVHARQPGRTRRTTDMEALGQ